MSNTNKEAPPRTEGLGPSQQRKRKRRADFDDAENTHPCFPNLNNTSVPLSNVFPRVLAVISNVHPNLSSSTVSIGNTPTNDNGKQENTLGKRLKSTSYNLMSQSSNQTTVINIVGGSKNVSKTLKRKISATIEVTENTPSMFSRKKRGAKSGVLTDITNVLPTANTLPFQLGTPSTSGSCITKISTKGKGKVLAGDNKFKTKTITKSCKKTLEAQFDGCVDGNSSSEDDEDQAYQCDYEGLNLYFLTLVLIYWSQRSPDVLSKTNTKTDSSCTRKTKSASSRKQYGTRFV
ncbi:hypothetical protein Bca52824_034777 [Brassica carinata]|uniref:Uncharacterized protein n=1 Tax=Brassica carinata TaxID=52824 RepID=A0A8X7UZV5_BRACI|nr:hypothetical protein Bca52824_034777 [Brassica carinata]